MKAFLSVLVICLATSALGNPFQEQLQRNIITDLLSGFLSGISNQFGIIAQYFKELSTSTLASVTSVLLKLYASGTEMVNLCKPILGQLVSDLTAHAYDSLEELFKKFVTTLNHQLSQGIHGKRDASDVSRNIFTNIFGSLIGSIGTQFAAIADYFKVLSSQVLGQFTSTVLQLVAQGSSMIELCKPIFVQLLKDLQSHALTSAESLFTAAITQLNHNLLQGHGKRDLEAKNAILDIILNTLGLKQLLEKLKELGSTAVAAFTAVVGQAYLTGGHVWSSILAVLKDLQHDLLEHTGTAAALFSNALTSMHFIINQQSGKRDLMEKSVIDTILNFFSGLAGPVIAQIKEYLAAVQHYAGASYSALVAVFTQALLVGGNVLTQSIEALGTLKPLLGGHVEGAGALVSQAISSIQWILSQHNQGY